MHGREAQMTRKIPNTITEQELITILKRVTKPKKRLAYMLAFYQCMRVSEVIMLSPDRVLLSQHLIQIKEGKGKKDRHIPIVKPILLKDNEINKALKHLPIKTTVRALQISFKLIANKVLGKDLHFHTLRHSGATWLLNKKRWDIRQVQQFLGHSKIQTTEIYTHVTPQDLIDLEWGEE